MIADLAALPEQKIVYDSKQHEYYNISTDIYLTEQEIANHKLRPYDKITTPLPAPLPKDYFTKWK